MFIPRDHQNGSLRGFTFVRFKTEWVANKAMQKLNGCLIGGRKIQIQMAQNDYGRQHIRMLTRRSLSVPAAHRSHRGFPSSHLPPAISKAPGFHPSGHRAPLPGHQSAAWTASDGGLAVVKVAASLSSPLREDLKDSFVVTLADYALPEEEVGWLKSSLQVSAIVKRLSAMMMLVFLSSPSDSQRMLLLPAVFGEGPLRWIDRWTEVLGPMVQLIWVRLEGFLFMLGLRRCFRCWVIA